MLPWFTKYPYQNDEILNLDWVLNHFKDFKDSIESLEEWRTTHEEEYQQLKDFYDGIVSGDFTPEFIAALDKWCRANLLDLVASTVRTVHFGLSSEGYFCALIPSNWDFVEFGTIQDGELYGHLTLRYE